MNETMLNGFIDEIKTASVGSAVKSYIGNVTGKTLRIAKNNLKNLEDFYGAGKKTISRSLDMKSAKGAVGDAIRNRKRALIGTGVAGGVGVAGAGAGLGAYKYLKSKKNGKR